MPRGAAAPAAAGAARGRALGLSLVAGLALLSGALALTPAAARLERDPGLGLLYWLRGPVAVPQEAAVLAINRRSVDWLRFHAGDLERAAPALARCLSAEARAALARAHAPGDLPRGIYACALERLGREGARAVAADILFAKETPEDPRLARAIAGVPTVLFERIETRSPAPGMTLRLRQRPRAAFAEAAAGTGMFLIEAPSGGYLEGYVTGLAEFPGLEDLARVAWRVATGAERGAEAAPEAPATRPLWLYAPPGGLAHRDLSEFLAGPEETGWAAGRAVFLGLSEPETPGAPDHFRVPVPGSDGRAMAGVEVIATAYLNRLRGEVPLRPGRAARAGLVAALAGLLWAAALLVPGRPGLVALVGLAALYAAGAAAAFLGLRLWLPVALPLFAVAPLALIAGLGLRYAGTRDLVRHLAPRPVAARLLDHGSVPSRDLVTEPATVLLADVVGSTGLGLEMRTEAYARAIQRFYDIAAGPIEREGGLLVEFLGDATLALFTETDTGPDHAARAVAAARGIAAALDAAGHIPELGPERRLRLRIALNTGPAATGDVGAASRYSYKALGEAVTLAFAIEAAGKRMRPGAGHLVLLSEATRAAAGLDDRATLPLGARRLPGRPRPLPLHRLRLGEGS